MARELCLFQDAWNPSLPACWETAETPLDIFISGWSSNHLSTQDSKELLNRKALVIAKY